MKAISGNALFRIARRAPRSLWGRGWIAWRAACWTLIVWCVCAGLAFGQEEGEEEETKLPPAPVDLLDRDPFFQLTLDAENGNAVVEIMPLDVVPPSPKPTDVLRVRLLNDLEQEYDIDWTHITKLRTYHQLVFDEATTRFQNKDYNGAFRCFDYLLHNTSPTPSLKIAVLEFLLENAGVLLAQQKIDHALVILEEITERDKEFRAAEVNEKLSQAADSLIKQAVEKGDFSQARGVMLRLEERYGASRIAALQGWRDQLVGQANQLKTQAEQKMAAEAWREADQLSRRLEDIWPELPGAAALRAEIARRYPMIFVGVSESASEQDATSLGGWPARRTGWLTERRLMAFRGAGPEGGKYLCDFGSFLQSDDRRSLTLELNQVPPENVLDYLDGFTVARRLMEMADPASPTYQPAWASLADKVGVRDVFTVEIGLRRPFVLPEALLQVRLTPPGSISDAVAGSGPFLGAASQDADVHFTANPRQKFPTENYPRELVERYFESTDAAVDALRKGEVDAVDFLFPDDAARLEGDPNIQVLQYALPTIHVLVPNHDKVFTGNQTFRRALTYGIGRQAILDAEVLGKRQVPGCQLISGPFPLGIRENDPLAYAYDQRIAPRPYDPRLGTILVTLARRELEEVAKKRGTQVPAENKLILSYPRNQLARVSCQAIGQYLKVIGVECELRELPPGASVDVTGESDLVYMQVAMWEPLTDARRLLAPTGIAAGGNEYVGLALQRLDGARNWREARTRLHELHRIVAEQVAIIPLWQTVNFLAHRKRLQGLGLRPLVLYEDVEQWHLVGEGQ